MTPNSQKHNVEMMDATRDTVRSIQKNGDAVSACVRMIGVCVLLAPVGRQQKLNNPCKLIGQTWSASKPATALLSNGSLTENDEQAD